MPLPQLANPGAPAPWQAAQASLIGALQQQPPGVGDPSLTPTDQQVTDVEQSPVHQLMRSYQQYHQQRQARQSAGSMMANRATAQTPMTQHLQQARGQNGGSMYINQGFGSLEDQNLPAYTQEQGMQDHPTEDFGPVAPTPATAAETQREQFELRKAHQEEIDKGQQQADKEATDYQQSLQGTGKYAAQQTRLGIEKERADTAATKVGSTHGLLTQQTTPAPGPVSTDESASPEGQAQAEEAKPAATPTGVKAIHPEGQTLRDPTTGKTYVVQNGQYVEQQ